MKIPPPDSMLAAFEDLLDEMYISNVIKRLRSLNQPSDIDRKRWIWELLQNAKDTISHNPNRDFIKARIIIDGNIVKFQHNGDPFTAKAKLALLYKFSEDKENAESTGRFGTGFLTTHCLSRVVSIESNMYGNNNEIIGFSVTMFRDGSLKDELLEGLKKMKDSEVYESEPYEWTTFTYHVNSESGRRAIKLGIENFKENIAQTCIFCKELESVELIDNGKKISIERVSDKILSSEISKVEFRIIQGDSEPIYRTFIYNSLEQADEELSKKYKASRSIRLQVACEIDKDKKDIISTEDSTSIFCVFPLVGIENQIQMPMFINSPDFEPDEERQSLLLNGVTIDEEKGLITETGINQRILSLVPHLYEKIIFYLSNSFYDGFYNLCNGLKSVKDHERLDKEWYKDNIISTLRTVIMKYPIVHSYATHKHKNISECIFIKSKKEDEDILFDIAQGVYEDKLVDGNSYWAHNLWKEDDIKLWDLEDFSIDIESKKQLGNINIVTGEDKLVWYNKFLAFVKRTNELLLKELALLPNRYGYFLSAGEEGFKQGENVSEVVLDLLSKLGEDMRPLLLHSGIYSISIDNKFNSNSFSAKVNNLIKAIIDSPVTSSSDSEKLCKLLPIISIEISDKEKYEESFINRRKHFFNITKELFELKDLSQTRDDSLNKVAWDALDSWLLNYILSTIESLQSLSNLPEGLDSKWINDVIINLNIPLSELNKKAIVPNQKGDFCFSSKLFFDEQIPDILKNEIFSKVGISFNDILIDINVDLRPLGKTDSKTIDDFATDLNKAVTGSQSHSYPYTHFCYGMYRKYNEEILKEIARFMINIIPKPCHPEDRSIVSIQNSLNRISYYFLGNSNPNHMSEIYYYDSKLWNRINEFICHDIVSTIEKSSSIANLMEEGKHSDEETLINNLNILYKYIESHNFNFASRPIYLNQKGNFSKKDSLYREGEQINDLLKDIIDLIADEDDKFYNILLDSRCSVTITQSKNSSDAYSYIDGRIDVLYKNPSNWDDENFRKAAQLLIDVWGDSHPALFDHNHFPKVYPIRDSISMNIIWTKSERQLHQIIRNNLNASDLTELVSNIEDFKGLKKLTSRNKELEDENARLKRELDELKRGRVANVNYTDDELTDKEKYQAQIDAQRCLKELRPDWEFPDNYGEWDGDVPYHDSTLEIKNEKHCKVPIVLKSYKNRSRPFMIGTNEWKWISNGARLFVYSEYDDGLGIREVEKEELIKKQSNFTITFDAENLNIDEYADRVSDFAEALHYFKGLHFDFDRFSISPTARRVQDIYAITVGNQPSLSDKEAL